MKTTNKILSAAFTLICFALSPSLQGVLPPPPGGYPNFTTAAGDRALQALSLGVGNTAVGTFSLFSVSTGNFNTAVGAGSLDLNQADFNTATGAAALLFNTAGTENTANGTAALEFNNTGDDNTAIGAFALFNNQASDRNNAVGSRALLSHTSGDYNNAVGTFALSSDTGGTQNNAFGDEALFSNTIGAANTAVGDNALHQNTTGSLNTAVGALALYANVGGNFDTALGAGAGSSVTGDSNICIGANVLGVAGENNRIRIGDNLPTGSGQSACYIGGIAGQAIDPGTGVLVGIDASGKLGTVASSRRFKRDIKPMDKASEAIHSLKPVTFHYKSDSKDTPCFGLIAEEVAAVNPDLVVRNKDGNPYTVRYDQVNAMLLNEFLKEHKTVQELKSVVVKQEAIVAQQQKQIEALTAAVQKVSAQFETNNSTAHVAENNY